MSFSHFLIFISEQWVLVFALLLSLNLLLFTESRKAGPALSPQQAINLTNREGGVFLDVRDAKEYKRAHISEAVNIPSANLQGRLGELENYRDKPVIVVLFAWGQAPVQLLSNFEPKDSLKRSEWRAA